MGCRNSFILCVIGVLVFTTVVQAQDPHGTPGVDYPNYFTMPETTFKCSDQKYNPGFYADIGTMCQAFHFCYQDRMESFLCPTGTIFNQAVLTCDVWYKSNCSLAPMFYSVNSGPVMERAGKNLPMLLRLRNRSQSKSSIQTSTASVLDKESSNYESDNEPLLEASSISKSSEFKNEASDKSFDSSFKDLDNQKDEQVLDSHEEFVSDEDASKETDMFTDEVDEEMDTNLVYDGLNDGYYENHDQYDSDWQGAESESREYKDFYDYGEPHEYEADARKSQLKYYTDRQSFEDSDLAIDSEYPELTKRSSQTGHTRVRRKPIYILDDQPEIKAEEMAEIDNFESISTNSGQREGKEMNLTSGSVEAETPSPTPFPRPTAIPHHLLNIPPVTPMTSEGFEEAILSELVYPFEGDEEGAEVFTSYPQSDQAFSQSEQTYNQSPDIQSDDTIYIEDDMESESYVPYDSQYEDVIVVPKSSEEASSDTEDTFVVIPDEYDDNVADFEEPGYHEAVYRSQILADQPPATVYDTYDSYRYSSSVDYPHYYEQANYPDQTAQMRENYMPNERYAYESRYELPSEPMNYDSTDFDSEETYAQTEFYPYEETRLGVTERPVALPVTEEDLDNFSNDFGEVAESEQDIKLGNEPGQPEDVYYVFDFDEEQSNQGNETDIKDEKMKPQEPLAEKSEQVNEQNPEVKPLNSSNESSVYNESSDIESERSEELTKTEESAWSSNSPSSSQSESNEPDNVKSDINTNSNILADSSLKYGSQTPPVHENLAPFSSNMGSFDFSSDSRFLNNMGYSESMDFGPYGFGPNMGQQFNMMESLHSQPINPFSQRMGTAEQPKVSPLSAIQEKMRSMKQGKFGAFKKYMSSTSK